MREDFQVLNRFWVGLESEAVFGVGFAKLNTLLFHPSTVEEP